MSSGGANEMPEPNQLWVMMGIADNSAITKTITANSLPISPRNRPGQNPGLCREEGRRKAGPPRSTALLVRLRLEGEVHGFGFVAGNGHVLRLSSVILLPGSEGVLARRQIRQRERASIARYRVMGSLEDSQIAVHPGMDVALHGNELLLSKLFRERRSARRLRCIPFAIDLGERVNVMRSLIGVDDLKLLAQAHGKNVGDVLASFLSEGDGLRRRGSLVGSAG